MDKCLNEDEFEQQYTTIEAPSGSTIWQREELVVNGQSLYPDEQVWTYVSDEADGAVAGWHVVNMLGYIVTEQPWKTGGESMVFDSACCYCGATIRLDDSGTWLSTTREKRCPLSPAKVHSRDEVDDLDDDHDGN